MLCSVENLLNYERDGNLASLGCSADNINIMSGRFECIMWLHITHINRRLKLDTFFYAVSLFDRCVEKIDLCTKYKLYAVACLSIAAKKYEFFPPEIEDYVWSCCREYSAHKIVNAEKTVFDILGCAIGIPSIMEYIRAISIENDGDYQTHLMAKVLCTNYLLYGLDILPSVLTTASYSMISKTKGCDFKNPFVIPKEIVDRASAIIAKRLSLINEEILFTKFDLRQLESDISIKTWIVNIIEQYITKDSVSIPDEYGVSHYTSHRKILETLSPKNIMSCGVLGEGTFGTVYKVKIDENTYARKKENGRCGNLSDGLYHSYVREIAILQSLTHKNIVKIHYILDDHSSIILDYMSFNLKRYIDLFPDIRIHPKFQQLCAENLLDGLKYMHSRGVIHRDIKPQNILVGGTFTSSYCESCDFTIKYCDFGGSRGSGIVVKDAKYTDEITTLWYRSPEILLGCKEYGPAVDVWSLMCTLCEIIVGFVLFAGQCEREQLNKIFMLLGTPNENNWPGVSSFYKYKKDFLNWPEDSLNLRSSTNNAKLIDTIKKGLIMNPSKRANASELLSLLQ